MLRRQMESIRKAQEEREMQAKEAARLSNVHSMGLTNPAMMQITATNENKRRDWKDEIDGLDASEVVEFIIDEKKSIPTRWVREALKVLVQELDSEDFLNFFGAAIQTRYEFQ